MNHNVFSSTITLYKLGQEDAVFYADHESQRLYRGALVGDYTEVSKQELMEFLRSAATQQSEDGLLHLINDDGAMPSDARIGLWYEPSWVAGAAGIYAFLQWPEDFDAQLRSFLAKILTAGVRFGMIGHGYEKYEEWLHNMILFAKAGTAVFLRENPSFSPEFTTCIQNGLQSCRKRLREAAQKQTIVYTGFVPSPVEAQIHQILAAYEGKDQMLFVYGTLMQGKRANSLLGDAIYGGRFLLKNYALYDLGAYPAIQKKDGCCAEGEVWFVAKEQFKQLDRYEGEGTLYARQKVLVESDRGKLEVQAYVYLPEVDTKPLCCAWEASDRDAVWYAGYGSNLSKERFSCYIIGGICKSNGRNYKGCRNKTPWSDMQNASMDGDLYFGNSSSSWNGKGVAFFDPNGAGQTQMRLYRITREQLKDVQQQEGKSANWYGRMVCLGIKDGSPIYTLTSETRQPENKPDEAYQSLLLNALICDCGYTNRSAQSYLKKRLPHQTSQKGVRSKKNANNDKK
jgi:gamma-glutamylcyclotransferase (GGCT)/AIG2-like uncharacterized protein YtfP